MNGIRYFRKKNQMTQSKLAEILGVTQTSVSQWESGRNYPDIKMAKRLAELFSASLDQILGTIDLSEGEVMSSPGKKRIVLEMKNDLDEQSLVLLEQKMHLVELMDKLSPLARLRVLDRAEIYYEVESYESEKASEEQAVKPLQESSDAPESAEAETED